VLTIAMFHFIPDDAEAAHIVQVFRDALPSGSYLALTHAAPDNVPQVDVERGEHLYQRATAQFHFRTREQIQRLFDGLELVEPGLVYIPLWRPETEDDLLIDEPRRVSNYAAVGRKA
jgi:hypothetical protein